MNNPQESSTVVGPGVGVLEGLGQLNSSLEGCSHRNRSRPASKRAQERIEVRSINVLHRDEEFAVLLTHPIHIDQASMFEPTADSGFVDQCLLLTLDVAWGRA